MDIPKNLREGVLKVNNISKSRIVDPEYTTFISESGKTRYPTDAVRGVVEYMAGSLPGDADPIMAIGYKLGTMKEFYNKFKPEKPKRLHTFD